MQGLQQDERDRAVIFGRDEIRHQRLAQRLFFREGGELCQFLIPLRDAALRVNTENRRVRSFDQPCQVVRDSLGFGHQPVQGRNVLANTNNTYDLADAISPGSRVQQHGIPLPELGQQRQLVIRCLLPSERFLQDLGHALPVLWLDEVLHKFLAYCFRLGVADHLSRLPIPLGDQAVAINAKNWGIRSVNEAGQVVRYAFLLPGDLADLCNVLPHADNSRDFVIWAAAGRGIDQDLPSRARLRNKGDLEVGGILAHQRQGFDLVDGLLKLRCNESGYKVFAQCLVLAETEQARGGGVPLIHLPLRVYTEYRRIRCFNQRHQALSNSL
mmetsp:Transcript_7857/g.22485  ORF Transcript_7857/g.22485 Transcript_7857/m.22485 type:complete len:327 (-) Transcript_7857:2-982(-)